MSSGALRIVRIGAVSPEAVRLYAVALWLPKFATQSSSRVVSTVTSTGPTMCVRSPLIMRTGSTSPFAVRRPWNCAPYHYAMPVSS